MAFTDALNEAVYVSGDTVWYEGVAAVARRFDVRAAVLFMGAARVPAVGPEALTMTAADGIKAACAFPKATIIPLHYEGWAHFTESREMIARAFDDAGIGHRVRWWNSAGRLPYCCSRAVSDHDAIWATNYGLGDSLLSLNNHRPLKHTLVNTA